MTDNKIREFLLKLIQDLDYDLYKSYSPEFSEEPEYAEQDMQRMINMTREFINENINPCDYIFHDDVKPYILGGD